MSVILDEDELEQALTARLREVYGSVVEEGVAGVVGDIMPVIRKWLAGEQTQ